jgi:hypothetical protein
MLILKWFLKWLTSYDVKVLNYLKLNPLAQQNECLNDIIQSSESSLYLKPFKLSSRSYLQFSQQVPVITYDDLEPWIEKIKKGDKNVLSRSNPLALVTSTGTTSSVKYLPLTKKMLKLSQTTGRRLVSQRMNENTDYEIALGVTLNIVGGSKLEWHKNIPSGVLSLVNTFYRPFYLRSKMLPSLEVQKIQDFDKRVEATLKELKDKKLKIIIGQPTWTLEFIEKVETLSMKKFKDLFPDIKLFLSGGINLDPYRKRLKFALGDQVECLDCYVASEGLFAYQENEVSDMLLNLEAGIFYEFKDLETEELVPLARVQTYIDYELIVSSISGLYRFQTGDIVQVTSQLPYRIKILGRTQQFINLSTEKMTERQVQKALSEVLQNKALNDCEWTLAPSRERNHYELALELKEDLSLSTLVDQELMKLNPFYAHARKENIIKNLAIVFIEVGTIVRTMDRLGKIGGQNKIPRAMNHRDFFEEVIHEN